MSNTRTMTSTVANPALNGESGKEKKRKNHVSSGGGKSTTTSAPVNSYWSTSEGKRVSGTIKALCRIQSDFKINKRWMTYAHGNSEMRSKD